MDIVLDFIQRDIIVSLEPFSNLSMAKRPLLKISFAVFVMIYLSSCQINDINISAQFTDQAIDSLLSKKGGDITPSNFQSADLLGSSVALFSVVNTAKIPIDVQEELKNYYQENVMWVWDS